MCAARRANGPRHIDHKHGRYDAVVMVVGAARCCGCCIPPEYKPLQFSCIARSNRRLLPLCGSHLLMLARAYCNTQRDTRFAPVANLRELVQFALRFERVLRLAYGCVLGLRRPRRDELEVAPSHSCRIEPALSARRTLYSTPDARARVQRFVKRRRRKRFSLLTRCTHLYCCKTRSRSVVSRLTNSAQTIAGGRLVTNVIR